MSLKGCGNGGVETREWRLGINGMKLERKLRSCGVAQDLKQWQEKLKQHLGAN